MHALCGDGAVFEPGQVPACTGDMTLLLQVKHKKNFLKFVQQLLVRIVMEHHLY